MASVEVNKLLMRAVSDASFRERLLADPVEAAKSEGVSEKVVKEVRGLDMARLQAQFGHLSRVSGELIGSVVSAGHSRDWSDRSNIHDNDDHIHDKGASAAGLESVVLPAERLTNIAAVRDALRDPAVLKEIESNPEIREALKRSIGGR